MSYPALAAAQKEAPEAESRNNVGKAYDPEEKARLIATAKTARSPHMYPALMLAQNAGLRSAEMKNLTWSQIDLEKRYLIVGRSKTEAGEGRTIPLNSTLHQALVEHSEWYAERFGEIRPEWYIFPFVQSATERPNQTGDHVEDRLGEPAYQRCSQRALAR